MSGNIYFVLISSTLWQEINSNISHSNIARVEQCCKILKTLQMKSELYNGWFYDGEGKGGRDSEAAG
jgi:hypothetical protein